MTEENEGVDLSGLHRELDQLKVRLCRCNHQGTCVACRGFEMLREQAQMVFAAASQPVLMQVAQEAAVNDLMQQMSQVQGMLADDPQLQSLTEQIMERVQQDVGGPEAMQQLMRQMGLMPGVNEIPPDDRPGLDDIKGDEES